jgi:hypothetical protein
MKPYLVIEAGGQGATYSNDKYTVYEISTYSRSSVLAGQQCRRWMDDFETLEEAKAAYPDAELIEGTTYQEPDLSHLPDDTDY